MGIWDAGISNGGSVNSGFSNAENYGSGYSNTNAAQANMISAQNAAIANALQREWWEQEMSYNANEAAKTRAFNEIMGNTLYTRSVKNMREAGINPILASNFGLSAAQVNSSAMASTSAPSSHMAQTFMDQNSAWESSGNSHSENNGSSWSNSMNGVAQTIGQIAGVLEGVLGSVNSGITINNSLAGLDSLIGNTGDKNNDGYDIGDTVSGVKDVVKGTKSLGEFVKDQLNPFNGGLFSEMKRMNKAAEESQRTIKAGKNVFEK